MDDLITMQDAAELMGRSVQNCYQRKSHDAAFPLAKQLRPNPGGGPPYALYSRADFVQYIALRQITPNDINAQREPRITEFNALARQFITAKRPEVSCD